MKIHPGHKQLYGSEGSDPPPAQYESPMAHPIAYQSMGQAAYQSMGQQSMGQQSMGQQFMGQQSMGQQSMGQQTIGQQPMGQQVIILQPTGQPMPMPANRCTDCGGEVKDNMSTPLGCLLCFLLFPCGIICYLSMRDRRCRKCGKVHPKPPTNQ